VAKVLITQRNGAVLRLSLNRPAQRNALSLELLDELGSVLERYRGDSRLKCVIIRAAGDRCFAAGGDLKELDRVRSEDEARAMAQKGRRTLDRIRCFPLPVIAALNGPALGGGAELAMACDARVAVEHAELGFLQAQLNVTTAWGGGIDLIAALGDNRALKLLLAGRRLSAARGHELGLIDRLCAPEQSLERCVDDFIEPYLARSYKVLRGFKALSASARMRLHEQLSGLEEARFVASWTDDAHWQAAAHALPAR